MWRLLAALKRPTLELLERDLTCNATF